MAANICCFTSQTLSSLENCKHFSAWRSGILTCMRTRSGSVSMASVPLIITPSSISVWLVILLVETVGKCRDFKKSFCFANYSNCYGRGRGEKLIIGHLFFKKRDYNPFFNLRLKVFYGKFSLKP